MAERWQRNPILEQQWRQRVADCKASGQSVREFCKSASVPESSFYAWRRELDKRDGLIASSSWKQPFAAVRIAPQSVPDAPKPPIEIILGEVTVRVPNGVDVTTLSHVLDLLKRGQDATSVSGGADSSVQTPRSTPRHHRIVTKEKRAARMASNPILEYTQQ